MRARLLLVTLTVAVSLALATTPIGASTPDSKVTGKTNGETIRLVTHDSFAVSQNVLDAFTARTGIKVEILQGGDAGTVVNQAILTKDNPVGDVLFGVDNTFLARALQAGIFERYKSPALDTVPASLRLDPKLRVTPVDYGDVCINYDKEWFKSHEVKVPKTLQDLRSRHTRASSWWRTRRPRRRGSRSCSQPSRPTARRSGSSTGSSCARTTCRWSTAGSRRSTTSSAAVAVTGAGRWSSRTRRARRRPCTSPTHPPTRRPSAP